jgi:hypothetical protein
VNDEHVETIEDNAEDQVAPSSIVLTFKAGFPRQAQKALHPEPAQATIRRHLPLLPEQYQPDPLVYRYLVSQPTPAVLFR